MEIEYIKDLEGHIKKLNDFMSAIVASERTERPSEEDTIFYFDMLKEYLEEEIQNQYPRY